MEYSLEPILSPLFPQASYLALNAGVSSWYKVEEASFYTKLSLEDVIETKCRLIADTLAYLLSFRFHEGGKVAWWIRLRGLNSFNQSTGVGHAFILIERLSGIYHLIDSYIGCRTLTYREVEYNDFMNKLRSLERNYTREMWYEITGCYEDEIPSHVKVVKVKYSYDDTISSMLSRYIELNNKTPDKRYGHHT